MIMSNTLLTIAIYQAPQWASDEKASDGDASASTQQNWSQSIELVKGSGGIYHINSQPSDVKAVAKEAILNFEVELVFHGCFPLPADRFRMARSAVIKAATDLRNKEILRRVQEDPVYCDKFASIVC